MNQCCKFNVLWWKSKKKRVLFQVGHDCRTFAVVVHEANAHDNVGADGVIDKMKGCFPRLKKMLADGGYKGRKLADTVRQKLGAEFTVVLRPDESPKKFSVLPLRCIVERSFSWLENFRRIAIDHEFYSDTGEAKVQLAFCRLMYNKLCD